jgi:hypothetical protein
MGEFGTKKNGTGEFLRGAVSVKGGISPFFSNVRSSPFEKGGMRGI